MAPRNKGPSLSVGALKHLGIETKNSQGGGRRNNTGVRNRKEQRKAARAKPRAQPPPHRQLPNRPVQQSKQQHGRPAARQPQPQSKAAGPAGNGSKPKGKSAPMRVVNPELEDDSIDEDDFDDDIDMSDEEEEGEDEDEDDDDDSDDASSTPTASAPKITGRMRERLQQDDAEIAELERKLGMKGRKNLPQSFKDDGLGDLLESLGGGGGSTEGGQEATKSSSKRKAEADEWLQAKRQKALGLQAPQKQPEDDDDNDDDDAEEEDGEFGGFTDSDASDGEEDTGRKSAKEAPKRQRENPYVAPVSASSAEPQRYVPPALRRAMQQGTESEAEAIQRVRRQANHLIARLSDANMLTILGAVEKLYQGNPRQYVTDAVTDKLLEQMQIDGALTNNVTVLIAGFATAVYMVKGTDFGAHFIQQNATVFKKHYDSLVQAEAEQAARDPKHLEAWAPASKVAFNLFSLMTELYSFRMIGPNLIYDYIRLFLGSLTETNTSLLLRVFETSGRRLRQDDPRAFKDIMSLIQPAVVKAGGEKALSVRTRYMLEGIKNSKKNEKKKKRNAELSGFGHAERIRKVLGNLRTSRKVEAASPVRVGLADIEQSDKRGKWWLVGASWAGRDSTADGAKDTDEVKETDEAKDTDEAKAGNSKKDDDDDVFGVWGDVVPDVQELDLLARQQGMKTFARRSIFVALTAAFDCNDAHAQLLRLRLNKYERREIPNVLIRCAGFEETYNRYYALVALKVCKHDRRMSWVFQTVMWKLFRRAGEQMFGEVPDADDGEADDDEDALSLRRIVSTAKLFGFLIASTMLTLDALKCLTLVRLQPKIRVFVEVLLITVFEETNMAAKRSGSNASAMIQRRFRLAKDRDDLRRGLQYFIDKVVRKTTLVEDEQKPRIAKACDRAQKALRESQED